MGINNLFNVTNFMIQVDWTVIYIHTLYTLYTYVVNVHYYANQCIFMCQCLYLLASLPAYL